ncbi:MAG: VCBS repeat-containing protein [Planctomycetes bacterium]|nr:VCBS repeat-containing protein [Planctomycetota bacterium]
MMKSLIIAITISAVCANAQQFRPEPAATFQRTQFAQSPTEIVVGDLDGDGFPDLLIGADPNGVRYLLNDRLGGFDDVSTSVFQPTRASAYGVSIGDADGDGDLDFAVAHDYWTTVQVCLNDGNGNFTDVTSAWSPAVPSTPQALTWIDIDGDRRLDLFVVALGGNALFRQQGGTLVDVTATHLPAGLSVPIGWRVRAADVDGDGDQDLLVFRNGFTPWLTNDGQGHFTVPPASSMPAALPILTGYGDFDGDGDGDQDLCTQDRLFLNDGADHFADVSASRWTPIVARAAFTGPQFVAADVDADEDLDVLAADSISRQFVSINHHRQVSAPVAPVRGGTYPLRFESQPGYAVGSTVVLPWFALAPFDQWIPPFGHLGVDPAATIAGPGFPIPAPGGLTTVVLTVPTDPALAGVTLYVQALQVGFGSAGFALTNAVLDRVQ